MLLDDIFLTSETTATAISQRLAAGEDFGTLATEFSEDEYSALRGGSLGWASYSSYTPKVADAVKALNIGEISKPIFVGQGWNIIRKVAEVKEGTAISRAPSAMLADLRDSGVDVALDAYVKRLRSTAKIEYIDKTLRPKSGQ